MSPKPNLPKSVGRHIPPGRHFSIPRPEILCRSIEKSRLPDPASRKLRRSSANPASYSCTAAYLWADTLAADAWEAFQEAPGGAWDADVAGRFHRHVLSAGNTVDPAAGYRAFRGRDPQIDALLRQRGFA